MCSSCLWKTTRTQFTYLLCSSGIGELLELSILTTCVAPTSGELLELSILTNCVAPAGGKLQELSLLTYCVALVVENY